MGPCISKVPTLTGLGLGGVDTAGLRELLWVGDGPTEEAMGRARDRKGKSRLGRKLSCVFVTS